ncbi:MAG: hypothetical protein IT236_03140 [Bacteroidia bacterium]|nr:hypothetical protein [Bacteroidia bacterium]
MPFLHKHIPFEFHLTISDLTNSNVEAFKKFCALHHAKPLLIELSRGEFTQQPMLCKTISSNDFEDVLKKVDELSEQMRNSNLMVKRVKIEIPAEDAALFAGNNGAFKNYFEWHGKINYENEKDLLRICEEHQAHLSVNALKNQTGLRYITLREFGSETVFNTRINLLRADLKNGDWKMVKEVSEYCIYDSNNGLDKGWLIN